MKTEDVKKLAGVFSDMSDDEQAMFLSEVALKFHEWGEERELTQMRAIAYSDELRYGYILITELSDMIRDKMKHGNG